VRWNNLLFDFDGTLVDSAPLHEAAFRAALARAAIPGAQDFAYEPLKGLSTRAAMRQLGVVDPGVLEACVTHKQRHYRDAVRAGQLALFAGARGLLAAVIASGGANYLVTSGSADSINLALDALDLGRYFTGVITAADVEAGKPAPDPYRVCLTRYRLAADASLAIGDAPAGVSAARAAGLRVAGVHNPEVAGIADCFAATLDELSRALHLDAPVGAPR
jgi:HAD superfamily hydrolase (TIGR01509 family)